MVDLLPAGQLQARLQARYGSRVQDHDRHVQRGGRRDHRRLGHQPHHRRRSGRGHRRRRQQVRRRGQLPRNPVRQRELPRLHQEHRRLHQRRRSTELPPDQPAGPRHQPGIRAGQARRLHEPPARPRRLRIPRRRGQTHRHGRRGRHQGQARREVRPQRRRYLLRAGSHRQRLRSRGNPAEQLCGERQGLRIQLHQPPVGRLRRRHHRRQQGPCEGRRRRLGELRQGRSVGDQLGYRARIGHHLQEGLEVPARERVHARVRLRPAAHLLRLLLRQLRRRRSRRHRNLRARHGVPDRRLDDLRHLAVRRTLDRDPRHDRLPQRGQRH